MFSCSYYQSVQLVSEMRLLLWYVTNLTLTKIVFCMTDYQSKLGYQLILGFSMYQNARKLLDTSGSKKPELIPCLDGIRFLSMTWVVIFHTYDYSAHTTLYTVINRKDIYEVKFVRLYNMHVVLKYCKAFSFF